MIKLPKQCRPRLAGLLLAGLAGTAHAAFDISISYTGSWTLAERNAFTQAETFWESVITGYQPSFVQALATANLSLGGISISAVSTGIDGPGLVLGSAGPTFVVDAGGYTLPVFGSMNFDSADTATLVANGSFANVIKHEMGHVLGIGTLWVDNGVYADGTGRYTGANALAAYRTEFSQPNASFVPVELGGNPGTADGHWNEVDGGAGLTGIRDAQGRDMRDELMTGWLNNGPNAYISQTTKASLLDIGYTVSGISAISAVPEPGMWLMLAVGTPLLTLRRRRRSTTPA
ncbi:MAG: hypothetical protein RLZZ584_2061 [Pseudomonadota bacterium]